MDIKKRIQELSLDQKAKLYFMGLVRKGIIDRLPDNPKAAYIRDMMDKDDYGRSVSGKDKRTFMEPEDLMPATRARKLAGMEDDPRMDPAIRSDFDDPMFENDKSKEDKLKMAYAAHDKAEMDGDIRGQELALAAIDLIKNTELDENLDEMKVTDKDGNDVTSDIIKKMEKSLEDAGYKITKGYSSDPDLRPGYKARPTKAEVNNPLSDEDQEEEDRNKEIDALDDIPDSLRELSTELGYLNEEEDLTFEPEDMDNPDEDLVIIGSGYLDIKSNFKGRPNMTNDELATLGQKVVDQLHKGDKEAALNYIYSRIN